MIKDGFDSNTGSSKEKYVFDDSKNEEMDLHDIFVRELIEKKSLAALHYLINAGRELEFKVNGKDFFLSRSGSSQVVSLWAGKAEQSFDSMEELLKSSVVDGCRFLSIWNQAEIGVLF